MLQSHPKPPNKPSFSPAWKTPARPLASWPPLEAGQPYQVTDTDSWAGLAKARNFPDPWDIIIFNFRTDVPEEVNWYMHHIMWCTESNDGKNFSFRGCGQRRIFMPPPEWIPDREYTRGSFNYRQLVRVVLRDLDIMIPRLQAVVYRGFVVTPFDYREVREKIAERVLTVRFAAHAELGDAVAQYDPDEDELALTRYSPVDMSSENDVIHELTHAVFDLKKYTARLIDEEIIARVEEAVHSFNTVGAILRRRVHDYRRLLGGDALRTATYFVGHVISTHLKDEPVINVLHHLDREFEHPFTGRMANPAHDLALGVSRAYKRWSEETTGNGIGGS